MIEPIQKLAERIFSFGGAPYLVGGAVRDAMMHSQNRPSFSPTEDFDIEVFGLSLDRIKAALDGTYSCDEVGEQFCVLKVRVPGVEHAVDVSIPREETKTGDGHQNFRVVGVPGMSFSEAALRRDFTMNALGWDIMNDELLDPHGGFKDIQDGWIRHVSERFIEDPLRPLRAARFAARFNISVHPDTVDFCRIMYPLAKHLPAERVWMELRNALLQAEWPGLFFATLDQIGWLGIFPEVAALRRVEQDPEWHPEGDVFIHTCHALDYWAQNLRTGEEEDDLTVAIAILCHDFGKVFATSTDQDGRIRALDHEAMGVMPAELFLLRLGQKELAKRVTPLVNDHLKPVVVTTNSAIRRLSTRVDRLDLLALLSKADQAGRPPKDPADGHAKIDAFMQKVHEIGVTKGKPKPLIGGDFLIELGLKPGPIFKEILDAVYELQLDGRVFGGADARRAAHTIAGTKGLL